MNFLGDKSYVALKPQSVATTPVIPTNFFGLVSESIRVNPNFEADRRMKGNDWKSDEILKGSRTIEGDLVLLGDVEALGHLLNMVYAKGSTSGNGTDGYTHPFLPGDGKSYTIEIPRGNYAQRIYGARGSNLKFEYENNKLKCTVSIKALGQFYGASLAVALTGAAQTTAVLSTEYDERPTDGLVVGDTIIVGGVEVVLTSVNANGTTLGFASTAITAAVGDALFLKAQTYSPGTFREPLYMGQTLVGLGADIAAATIAAGARATATPCYQIVSNLKNNLLDAPASNFNGPAVLLNQTKEADLNLKTLFETPGAFQQWIEAAKRAVTIVVTGKAIKTDLTTFELLSIKYHKVKRLTNENAVEKGAYIYDDQKFEALYDNGDAQSIEISIVNRTAAASY